MGANSDDVALIQIRRIIEAAGWRIVATSTAGDVLEITAQRQKGETAGQRTALRPEEIGPAAEPSEQISET